MKRAALGGAHRGPVAATRQRRTMRFVQVLLVLIAVTLLALAVWSGMQIVGGEGGVDSLQPPSWPQAIVLGILGAVSFAAALLLQGDGTVRVPSPARLDELAGRAEAIAIDKAEDAARSTEG